MDVIPYLRSVIVYVQLFGESFTKHVCANENIIWKICYVFKETKYMFDFSNNSKIQKIQNMISKKSLHTNFENKSRKYCFLSLDQDI